MGKKKPRLAARAITAMPLLPHYAIYHAIIGADATTPPSPSPGAARATKRRGHGAELILRYLLPPFRATTRDACARRAADAELPMRLPFNDFVAAEAI